jgi:hypothetical protein
MEGGLKFRVSAYDEKSNMICKDAEVGLDEAMLVEGLKNLILSKSAEFRNVDRNAFQLRSRDGQNLPPNGRVVDFFPGCRAGMDISVAVVPFVAPAVAAPSAVSGLQKDSASKASKNIKAMAKLNEDKLCTFLLENASPETVQDLADLKKPGGGGQKRKGSSGSAAVIRSMEWTKLYNAIKTNVQMTLERYATGQPVEEGIIVDQTLTLEEFASQIQKPEAGGGGGGGGGNNSNNNFNVGLIPLTTMSRWVLDADDAVKTCQRFAIANCITLGIRLKQVRNLWDEFKHSPAAVSTGIYTLESYYKFLGIEYTVDYVRKLIQMGVLGKLFPNLALISCCGIGDLIKYASDFVRMMQDSPSDAVFWRCGKNRMFAWLRTTSVVAYEGTKKRKVFDHIEAAPSTTFEDWRKECTDQMAAMLAEDVAASQLAAARNKEMDELIEEVQAEMEEEEEM